MTQQSMAGASTMTKYVTASIGDQVFGVPIGRVIDVFKPSGITRVPLSSCDIEGVLNLRGRIVTVINLRARLGLPRGQSGDGSMAIGIDLANEAYCLFVDAIGEVLCLEDSACEANPVNLDPLIATMAAGVHRLDGQLMIVLDADRVLDFSAGSALH